MEKKPIENKVGGVIIFIFKFNGIKHNQFWKNSIVRDVAEVKM